MKNTAHRKTLIAASAADFAEWLNNSKRTPVLGGETVLSKFSAMLPRARDFARASIRPLVELTLGFVRDRRKARTGLARYESFEEYVGKIDPLLARIVKLHPIQPIFSDQSNETGVPTFEYAPIPKTRRAKGGLDPMFTQAFQDSEQLALRLNQFFDLAREGAFASFRRCALSSCGQYFHALRPERRYCSKDCQRTEYLDDPLRAKKNAADQKVYYYTRKILDLAKSRDLDASTRNEYDRAERSLKSAKRAQRLVARAAGKGR